MDDFVPQYGGDQIRDENDEFELSESESEDESDTEVNDEGANKVGGNVNPPPESETLPAQPTRRTTGRGRKKTRQSGIDQRNIITRTSRRSSGTATRSGRTVRQPSNLSSRRLGQLGALAQQILDDDEAAYFMALKYTDTFSDDEICKQAGANVISSLFEVAGVGAGTGNEFSNTAELKPMKYKAAMKCDDKELWVQAVEEEYKKFVKYGVFKPVKREDVPKNAKFVSTT